MAYVLPILLLIGQLSDLTLAWESDLPPEPYCGRYNICCKGREDRCTHTVISELGNTMCYCDEFCHRPDEHNDCCEDYYTVCGSNRTTTPVPTTEPPTETTPTVTETTPTVTETTPTVTETTPTVTETTPAPANFTDCKSCDNDQDEDCSNHRCLIQDDIIKQVNNRNLGWRASDYRQFSGKKLKDGLIYKLGTFERSLTLSRMGTVRSGYDEPHLTEFDARSRWPHLISPIVDQGWCGSDWAVSLATVVSDRYAVQSKGAEKVRVSPQTLLSCNDQRQKGCKGGHVDTAWRYAEIYGLVDEDCFPYKAKQTPCPFLPTDDLLHGNCTPVVPERTERYKVGGLTRLRSEKDVMNDILHSGPIQVMMEVYQDFFHYKGGVYRRSKYGDQIMKGFHTVRLIGWGEENGQKYWIVANSWGTEWGEDGYFRIARGVNECDVESFMVSVLCYVTQSSS